MRSLMMKRKVKKVFDYSKLRGKIKEMFGTQAKFAKAMGMSTVTLSAKLNGTVQFTAPEMNKACEVLGVSVEFIPLYFFTEKVKTGYAAVRNQSGTGCWIDREK